MLERSRVKRGDGKMAGELIKKDFEQMLKRARIEKKS